jgi:membrane protein
LRRAAFATWRDGCLGIAKAAAYSALLSFFPVLTSVTTILVQAKAESVSRVLAQFLLGVVPPGTQELVQYSVTVRGARPGLLLVVAIIVSIWAASGLMASLIEGFHRAYRMRSNRGIVRERLVAILLVFFAALPAIGASALILFGTRTEHWLLAWLGVLWPGERLSGWVAWFGMLIRVGVAVGTIVLVTALLYHFGPARPRVWRRVWPGALVATILWLLATMAFAWYVRNIANYNVLYGSIGAVIALLVWMYLLAVIALLGCEFNAERDRVAAPAPAAEHEPA